MKITSFTPVDPQMGKTRTYEHFYKYLGSNTHRLGLVSRMYPNHTALFITEALNNTFLSDDKQNSRNKFTSINSMVFEWEITTNFVKRVQFAESPEDTSGEGGVIVMAFTENYFQKYDIFVIDKSRQQCQVVSRPIRKNDKYWQVEVRLIDNDYSSELDLSACQRGDTAHFISNAHPELSEEGYVKYTTNLEKHRNYITTFRNDVSVSSLYAAQEEMFTTISNNKGKEKNLKLNKAEKDLFDNFMFSRSTGLLLNKSNVTVDGKPTIQAPDTNRDIYIGDGLIPQIEKVCNKHVYNDLTPATITTALNSLVERSDNPTGNVFMCACNTKFWNDFNTLMRMQSIKLDKCDGMMYSKGAKGYITLGATYEGYTVGGNTIMFKPDKALNIEFGNDKGYCIILDLTVDGSTGVPAVNMFSLKGGEFIAGDLIGVGGKNGVTSGPVSTMVAGSQYTIMGYAGIGVMNPYKSYIMLQS